MFLHLHGAQKEGFLWMTGSVGLGASGRGAKELMEVSSWYRMGWIQAQNRPATKSLNWFKEKSAGTADILFSHLGQKPMGFLQQFQPLAVVPRVCGVQHGSV